MDDARWPELSSLRPGVIPLGPLTPGEIFTAALATLRAHAAVLFGTAFIVVALSELLARTLMLPLLTELPRLSQQPTPEQFNAYLSDLLPIMGIDIVLGLLGLLFVSGFTTIVVSKAVLGEQIGFEQAWARLRPMVPALLGLTLLTSVLIGVGLLFFLVPGIWIGVLLSLAAPALILEHGTITGSLKRSIELVRHNWWRIFGMIVALIGISLVVQLLVSIPFGVPPEGPGDDLITLPVIGAIVSGTVTAPFAAAVTAFIYIDRRFRTDDLALELAAAAGKTPPDALR